MIQIKINNIDFLISSSLSVLEACRYAGIYVPKFCYYENLSIAGNCRMCLVEIEKSPKPVASCALPVSNNLIVYTNSPLVKKARENILESILINHPLDCPICDQGGECDLQDQAKVFGSDYSRYFKNKRTVEDKKFGKFIKTVMTRCIHCTRCVRFSDELAGIGTFGVLNRGITTEIGSYNLNFFNSEISGNVIDLCPVGALTSKPYTFKARPWEIRCQETLDCTDSLGLKILVNYKESEIVRIQPKFNFYNSLISDKIRFSFDSNKLNRIKQAYENMKSKFANCTWDSIFQTINLKLAKKEYITFLINDNLDLKTQYFLKSLENKTTFIRSIDKININSQYLMTDGFDEILNDKIKTCFILASNLKVENTLINTVLRIKYKKQVVEIFSSSAYYKSNFPLIFINLDITKTIKIFEGKIKFSKQLIKQTLVILIVGNSIKKKIYNIQPLFYKFKTIFPAGKIIQNNLKIGSKTSDFFGIKPLNSRILKKTKIFICFNLEDNIVLRKVLKKRAYIWFNTHGSVLALKASHIAPITTFFENEFIFLTSNGFGRKTNKIINNSLESKSVVLVTSTILQNFKKSLKFLNHISFIKEQANSEILINKNFFKNFWNFNKTKINSCFIKSSKEDFYLDSIFTKNSILLTEKSQEYRKDFSIF